MTERYSVARRIVQIAGVDGALYALANDGTFWRWLERDGRFGEWVEHQGLPARAVESLPRPMSFRP